MTNMMHEDVDRILADLEDSEELPTSGEQGQGEPIRLIDVHIYDLPPQDVAASAPTVESYVQAPDTVAQPLNEEQAPAPPRAAPKAPRRLSPLAFVLLGAGLMSAIALVVISLLLLLAPPVTVTIIPETATVTTTTALTLVTTGKTDPAREQIPARWLPTLILAQAQTTPTTGTGYQPAQAARGYVTFYNAYPGVQIVAAGTLLTGADGREIVTDQEAVIPAGTLSTNGAVTVSAHAVEVGPTGNIAAHDLYGPCCRENVFVQNQQAFYGGENARSYPMVTAQDINRAVAALKTSLTQSIQAALSAQVQAGESLLSPTCTPAVSSDHRPGQEATQVTVTESCHGVAYSTRQLAALLTEQNSREAHARLGTGYTLSGRIQVQRIQGGTPTKQQGAIPLRVTASGLWADQFDQQQLDHLTRQVAGKSSQQATSLLLHTAGIHQIVLRNAGATFPTDPALIHLVVLYGSAAQSIGDG
jgi:hypothetical protein